MTPHRKGVPFEQHEDDFINSLVAQGKTAIQIARHLSPILGRTVQALQVRAHRIKGRQRRYNKPVFVITTIRILKDDLPLYFELGWRVAWFDRDQVGLEWPRLSEPRYPKLVGVCPSPAAIGPERVAA